MQSHGFRVTPHYLGLETAWRAEFQHLKGGRTIGVNAEMDALQGMGHACGHNLIAISGVGVALALKAALQTHNVPGKVVLLGTPGPLLPSSFLLSHPLSLPPSPLAEEGGGGKIILLKRGGYKDMDACIMYGLASYSTCWPRHQSPQVSSSSWSASFRQYRVSNGFTNHPG